MSEFGCQTKLEERKLEEGKLEEGNNVGHEEELKPMVRSMCQDGEFCLDRYISHALQELVWLQLLVTELGIGRSEPTKLLSKSEGAIAVAKNPEYHSRTQHIKLRYPFVRQEYQAGNLGFQWIKDTDQVLDGFTKPLKKVNFARFVNLLRMRQSQ